MTTTDHTPPETCPGCSCSELVPGFDVAPDGKYGYRKFQCGTTWSELYNISNFCRDGWAWAAQHRPLVAELVAALNGIDQMALYPADVAPETIGNFPALLERIHEMAHTAVAKLEGNAP